MKRGKQKQQKIRLPRGWWGRLVLYCDRKWRERHTEKIDIYEFTRISRRTFGTARQKNRMTEATFIQLGKEIGPISAQELMAVLTGHPLADSSKAPVASLTPAESADCERRYVAMARDGLYEHAHSIAAEALRRATEGVDFELTAHWANRLAGSHRMAGKMREASAFYARSWDYLQRAMSERPDDFRLRCLACSVRFGQIIVDEFMMKGALAEAHRRHGLLHEDAIELATHAPSPELVQAIELRTIHVRRQQAEMIRLQGRYAEAIKAIRPIIQEYGETAYEARSYALLAEGDSMRLLGNMDAALATYARVERFARERSLPGLLGAVLWRQCGAWQYNGKKNLVEKAQQELEEIIKNNEGRYHFVTLYSMLVRAACPWTDPTTVLDLLAKVRTFGSLKFDHLTLEYAHCVLVEGELHRRLGENTKAAPLFEEARRVYDRTGCTWGRVRSWIGLKLCDGSGDAPTGFDGRKAEGLDRQLWQKFKTGVVPPAGTLSINLP